MFQTIRRLYFYGVSLVAGLTVLYGLAGLLSSLARLVLAWPAVAGNLLEGIVWRVAMLLVATPVWAFHWWMAERAARRDSLEWGSLWRRLYLAILLLVSAATSLSSLDSAWVRLLQQGSERPAGGYWSGGSARRPRQLAGVDGRLVLLRTPGGRALAAGLPRHARPLVRLPAVASRALDRGDRRRRAGNPNRCPGDPPEPPPAGGPAGKAAAG